MAWTGFGNLDLSKVAAEGEGSKLRAGSYSCRITKAEVKDTASGNGGKVLYVTLDGVNGEGSITDRINIHNPNPQTVEIALRRLASLLRNGGHPNPNKPGDVKSMLGLVVGVHVDPEEYQDKEGQTRMGSKIRDRGAYFSVAGGVPTMPSPQRSAGAVPHDEIPF